MKKKTKSTYGDNMGEAFMRYGERAAFSGSAHAFVNRMRKWVRLHTPRGPAYKRFQALSLRGYLEELDKIEKGLKKWKEESSCQS
jgi:hypothetical protein